MNILYRVRIPGGGPVLLDDSIETESVAPHDVAYDLSCFLSRLFPDALVLVSLASHTVTL